MTIARLTVADLQRTLSVLPVPNSRRASYAAEQAPFWATSYPVASQQANRRTINAKESRQSRRSFDMGTNVLRSGHSARCNCRGRKTPGELEESRLFRA